MSNGEKKRNNGSSAKGRSSSSKGSTPKANGGTSRSASFEDKELEKAYAGAIRKFGDNLKRLTD